MENFLHVADVHLDSPLANLKRLDENAAERLQRASRHSLEVVVDTAIEREVAAVLIAGDLFDGPVKDASAGLWVEQQFKRLTREGIEVVLIRGNHDAASNARRVSHWPEGVHEFGADEASTVWIESAGLAIHGQSFGARAETADLAAKYPRPSMGYFNIGLLHTSLSGAVSQHDTYAPTSLATLENAGYDYWALGHIHQRSRESLSSKCYIGYSGNTQGRHIREPGAKGCQFVQLQDGKIRSVDFVPTDSLRWYEISLDVSPLEHLRDVEDLLEPQIVPLGETAGDRPLAVRIRITGETMLHAELTKHGNRQQLTDTLAHRLSEVGDIWLEAVKVASTPFVKHSSEELLLPLKYLSQVAESFRTDDALRTELEDAVEELLKKARPDLNEYGWPLAGGKERELELARLLGVAEELLVARLVGGQST